MVTRLYPLTLTLQAPAQIAGAEPGRTLAFLPGSAVRGAVAAGLRASGTGDEMQSLVLSGAVCYLNGYLQVGERRSLPAPLTYVADATDSRLVDTSALDGEEWPADGLRPFEGIFAAAAAEGVRLVGPERVRRTHRMVRGAAGRGDEGSPLMTVEALAAGQRFLALIAVTAGDEPACEALRQRVSTALGPVLSVGRSRRVAYGGQARIGWGVAVGRECDARDGAQEADLLAGDAMRLLLTADYLGRRADTGEVDPLALVDEVVAALGGRVEPLFERSGWDTRPTGGYSRTWGLPLTGGLALRAGSVLVLRALAPIPLVDLLAVEAAGFGERRESGYGRAVFLRPGEREVVRAPERAAGTRARPAPPSRPPGALIARMEERLLDDGVALEIGRVASEAARGVAPRTIPPEALLGRLRALLRQPPAAALEGLFAWTGERPPADGIRSEERAALERCSVRLFGRRSSLARLLHALADPRSSAPESWLRLEALAARRHIVAAEAARARLLAPERRPLMRVRLAAALLDALAQRGAVGMRGVGGAGTSELTERQGPDDEAAPDPTVASDAHGPDGADGLDEAVDLDEAEGTDGDDE